MDGELRKLFRQNLPHFHWTAIETWPVSHGVPDMNYCAPGGVEGWVEAKKIKGWKIPWKPPYLQVAWHDRRARVGGRTFFAVRRDQALYLVRGCNAKILLEQGLRGTPWAGSWEGGPAKWNWAEIGLILSGQFTTSQEQDNPQEREDSGCGPSPSPHHAARPK